MTPEREIYLKMVSRGENKYYLVFDIGGTNTKCGLFSSSGDLVSANESSTPQLYDELVGFIINKCAEYKTSQVSIGLPGTVDYGDGKIIYAPNLTCLSGKKIVSDLSNEKIVACIENDANLAALGEYYFSDIKYDSIVLVTLGTGVGGGYIVNGNVYKGQLSVFEIGHMTIHTDGKQCGCGKRGCFEAYCSKTGLENIYYDLSNNRVSINEILKLIDKKDSLAGVAMNVFSKYLGIGLSNIVNLLIPDVIVIGGGLSELSSYYFKNTIKVFSKNLFNPYKNSTRLIVSKLKNKAALYGGFYLLRQNNGQI